MSAIAASTTTYPPPSNLDMTVEDYMREQCDRQVKQLLAHAKQRIEHFKTEAASVKGELGKVTELPEGKFSTF